MKSPTQLSLDYLRKSGYHAVVVEHWIQYPRKGGFRKDLLGFGDILAMKKDELLLVQTTSSSNVSARIDKIEGLTEYYIWKRGGGRVVVHGWGNKGLREEWL